MAILLIFLSASTVLAKDYFFVVERGDCLSMIGQAFGLKWREIAKANNVKGPKYVIYPGQKLFLFSDKESTTPVKEEIEVATFTDTEEVVSEKEVVVTAKTDYTAKASKLKSNFDWFDAYINAGYYEAFGGDKENHGQYISGKLRLFPYQTMIDGKKVQVGIFGRYEVGEGSVSGISNNGYSWSTDYDWRGFSVGPSLKVNGKDWESITDIGLGKSWSENNKGIEQIDTILYFSEFFSTDKRRIEGKEWFPRTELFLSGSLSLDAERHDSSGNELKADNKEKFDITLLQEIYRFNMGGQTTIAPNFQIGTGVDTGHTIGKIGVGVKFRDYGHEIFALSVGPKAKEGTSGLTWLVNATVSIGGTIEACRASRIKSATVDDIQARLAKKSSPKLEFDFSEK